MDPNKYFSGYYLKNEGKSLSMLFGKEFSTLRPVTYISIDFKKLVRHPHVTDPVVSNFSL